MNEDANPDEGLRERLSARGAEAIGGIAESLLDNPYFKQGLRAASDARDKALSAQRAAMEALNLPTADEIQRLERRLRRLSQRLEEMEDTIDRMEAGERVD